MRIIIISFFLIFFISSQNKAQNLLNELESIESNNIPLLPEKFLVTKKIFWGKKDFNSLLNIEDIPQTKRLTIQSSNKKINNPRDLNEISYKNNISLNFAKKSTKKKKDTFKDISEFVPRTNIFSKFK